MKTKTIMLGALLTAVFAFSMNGAIAIDEMECDVTPGMTWTDGKCASNDAAGSGNEAKYSNALCVLEPNTPRDIKQTLATMFAKKEHNFSKCDFSEGEDYIHEDEKYFECRDNGAVVRFWFGCTLFREPNRFQKFGNDPVAIGISRALCDFMGSNSRYDEDIIYCEVAEAFVNRKSGQSSIKTDCEKFGGKLSEVEVYSGNPEAPHAKDIQCRGILKP